MAQDNGHPSQWVRRLAALDRNKWAVLHTQATLKGLQCSLELKECKSKLQVLNRIDIENATLWIFGHHSPQCDCNKSVLACLFDRTATNCRSAAIKCVRCSCPVLCQSHLSSVSTRSWKHHCISTQWMRSNVKVHLMNQWNAATLRWHCAECPLQFCSTVFTECLLKGKLKNGVSAWNFQKF